MGGNHRFQNTLAGSACALVALSALAMAQSRPPDVECKATETQAECHARLKCKATEELEDCKKRLLKGDSSTQGGTHEADKPGGERRDRDEPDKDRGEHRDRDGSSSSGRERGDSRGDNRGDDRGDDRGDSRRDNRRDDGDRRRSSRGGKGFVANKVFGLGLEVGEPTGLNGKWFLSKSGALDFGVGWVYSHYYYGDGAHLYVDYLWHPTSLVSAPGFELPFYVGVGLRYWDFHYCYQRVCDYGGSAIGLRIPVGISFDFNRVPLDIFLQLVPVIDFVNGDYYDRYRNREHFGVDLSAGVRFWFK